MKISALLPASLRNRYGRHNSIDPEESLLVAQLDDKPDPLRDFSVLKDQQAELVEFIHQCWAWKEAWWRFTPRDVRKNNCIIDQQWREAYEKAAKIYFEFIATHTSLQPVIISDRHMRHLQEAFKALAYRISDRNDHVFTVTSRAFDPTSRSESGISGHMESLLLAPVPPTRVNELMGFITVAPGSYTSRLAPGATPKKFSVEVFDEVLPDIVAKVLGGVWKPFLAQSKDTDLVFHARDYRRQQEARSSAAH